MNLTRMEAEVVGRLRRNRVSAMKTLRQELGVSHMTVFRALRKHGYYSSVNHNASYYTLHEIPRFDEDGLWTYRGICFSKHGSLSKTLESLVEKSPAGMTIGEVEQRVNTKAGNLLSRLRQQQQLSRCFAGHRVVYLAVDSRKRARQERQRRERLAAGVSRRSSADEARFPERYDAVTVLEVLIQIIKSPAAEPAELAKALRARGVKISAARVRRVLEFYAVKKKRNARRRGSRASAGA